MRLPIAAIVVGERRREDMGDIADLAASLRRYGLLHPVVVDDKGILVAGCRRLQAAKLAGWSEIEVTRLANLSEAALREIELEENLRRKDLTPHEANRTLLDLVNTARVVLSQEADLRTDSVRKSRGHPLRPASYRSVAERIGVPVQTIRDAEQHVEAVERYPELEDLPQTPAIATAKALDELPIPRREQVREVIAALPADERKQLAREQAKAEAAYGDKLLAIVGDPDGNIARAALKASYSAALHAVRSKLLPLSVESIAAVLDSNDWDSARWFIADTRAWLEALEAARPNGLRLVGERD